MVQSTQNVRRLFDALVAGEIDRRQFIQRTTALGIGIGMAGHLANAAAQEEAKGGGGLESGVPRAVAPDDQTRGAGGELKIMQWQAPSHLFAHRADGDKDVLASCLVTEPLMHYGQDAGLLPNLVTSVPSLANGDLAEDLSAVTLHLIEDVTWSDGEPFTSADLKFTWEWVSNPDNACNTIEIWNRITAIETPDDVTANVTFDGPNPLWYQPFTSNGTGSLLPKHILEGADEDAVVGYMQRPVGTGPFIVTEFAAGDEVKYAANETFRDANKPFFSTVYLKGGGDAAAAARSVLQTGEFHYAWFLGIDADLLAEMAAAGAGQLILYSQGYAERLHINFSDPNQEVDGQRSEMNTPHPFFSDPVVRRAMMLAVNRQLIADELFIPDSIETAAKDLFTGISSLESPNTTLEFDPEEAAKILDEAGWVMDGDVRAKDGVKLQIHFVSTSSQLRQKIQAVVKANLEAVGFKVDIEGIDSSIYFDSAVGNDQNSSHFYYDMNMHQTAAGAPTPIAFVQRWYAGPDGENVAQKSNDWSRTNTQRYRSDEYDALFDQVRNETDAAKQIELFIAMSDHLINNNVLVPLVAVAERSGCAIWMNADSLHLGPFGMDYWNIANWYGTPPA